MKINTLIVDDDPSWRQTLSEYVALMPILNLVDTCLRAQDHFLQVVTSQKTYLPMLPLSKMEEQLKGDVFLRVHRSYLVHRGPSASSPKMRFT